MKSSPTRRMLLAGAGIAALALPLAACSGGGGGSSDGKIEISYLTQSDDANTNQAKALIAAFEKANPDITVKLETQPGGTEGDNLMKTKLSTDSMNDVFHYNSGSLLQALNPDQTLVNLSDEDWVSDLTDDFKAVVSTDNGLYGAPWGTSFAGAVLYNKKVYEKLGLEIPTTWDEFIANSEKIKAEGGGVTPILQSFGDTWTSQLFVLGDFANVSAVNPDWAEEYTANDPKAKYVEEPAFAGFAHGAEVFEKGLLNEDFASMTNAQAMDALATGAGAQYPILSANISQVQQDNPDKVDDIGTFALPAADADDTSITMWQPNAIYIAKTTEGDKLEAAKKFVAFANSDEGCQVQNEGGSIAGPYVTSACTLPDDVPALVADIQAYFDSGKTGSALEFLSPIKGPNLENITVAVGSGITSAEEGAAQYDDDVKKQAQQLGLEGW
ncbi:carbohydrate ABC transporter substrate-binding protein [Microbacterium jejuense]|uniref:Carbohydrate ABC transporter substrate-binding protein n=1 Tax=Microbacterium jejuense TaxID=1263637 RepID=A0ABS7HQQ4_9MICO|nr:ABC transporter substrate-binding protein [Microbacterium jejuense]MBW9094359.1 carbohydrate ABC transporter substrate-binding protein [Microbacterium jejuense]